MSIVRDEPMRDTEAWRALHSCLKDPAWAPTTLLAATRKALKAHDTHLDVWWSSARERWQIMHFMPRVNCWETIFYWQGHDGSYREPGPADSILRRLYAMDVTRTGKDLKQVAKECDAARVKADETKKETVCREGGAAAYDFGLSRSGKRLRIQVPGFKKKGARRAHVPASR